jgi:hypothetical protein
VSSALKNSSVAQRPGHEHEIVGVHLDDGAAFGEVLSERAGTRSS